MAETTTIKYKDEVRLQAIHRERIKKENASFKLSTIYSINPFKADSHVTGKPNSVDDAWELIQEKGDSKFLEIIANANLEPTKKYESPQTNNQEYGWISQPLLHVDKTDQRLYFPQNKSAITQFWETAWHHGVSMTTKSKIDGGASGTTLK